MSPIPISNQSPGAKPCLDDREEHTLIDRDESVLDSTQKLDKAVTETPARLDPNSPRRFSHSPFSQNVPITPRGASPAPPKRLTPKGGILVRYGFKGFFKSVWERNGGPILMIFSQLFGATMNLSARLLQVQEGFHPMQILFVRMVATTVVCFAYMWWKSVPSAPWGPPGVRWLLVLRACSGFFGLYGMWCSIRYLPLAEATVISFLAPNVAGYLCRVLLGDPFTRREQLASYVALAGIVLITRPIALFTSAPDTPAPADDDVFAAAATTNATTALTAAAAVAAGDEAMQAVLEHVPTVAQRLSGIGMGLVGVAGTAASIVVLRAIGPRAHPLLSVNYFGLFCTLVTATALTAAPALGWDQPALRLASVLPRTPRQAGLLLAVGLCGFGTQLTITAGLARGSRDNRATAMIYTNVLFAATYDRLVFGHDMGWVSVLGCALVVGSALWVVLGKRKDAAAEAPRGARRVAGDLEVGHAAAAAPGGEDVPMLADVEEEEGINARNVGGRGDIVELRSV